MIVFDMDTADDRFAVCRAIITENLHDASPAVQERVALYALGNIGAASELSLLVKARGVSSIQAVDMLVDTFGVVGSKLYGALKEARLAESKSKDN